MNASTVGQPKPIIVEVAADPIIPARSGTTKGGSRYEIPPKQKAYFHNVSRYPVEGEVVVPDLGSYRPGLYLLAGECFTPGQYGLQFDDRAAQLIPLEDAMKVFDGMKAK